MDPQIPKYLIYGKRISPLKGKSLPNAFPSWNIRMKKTFKGDLELNFFPPDLPNYQNYQP